MAAETFYVNLPGEERDPNPRCKRNNSQQEARLVNATIKAYLFNYLKLEIAQIKSGLGFGSTACYNKNQNKCDPYDDSDVPYYMPHFCNYADCSTYTGCHIKDDYESGSSNSGEDSTVKTVEIFTGKRYKITFYNEGFFNTMSGIVNGIYADEDDVLSGYINFTAFDSNCSNPTVCNSGTKVSIGIGNIQDVEEIVDTSNNKPDDSDTTYEGEIKVMILGITATTIRSLVIRLGLINDNPDEATTYVDMEVGKTYHLVYSKNNTVYEIEGKLVDITELSKYWENGDHQFVRNIGDYMEGGLGKYPGSGLYDKKYNVNNKIGSKIYPDQPFYPPKNPPVPGMYGVPYEELSEQDAFLCCDKDKIHDVKFTFDTGTNGYQCFETVMLSSIRDCCNVSDTCPCPPAPPMPNPDHDVSVEINGNEVHFKAEGDYLVIISSAPDSVKTMSDYLVTTYTDPKSIVAVAQNTFDTTNPVLPGNVDFTSTIEYGHYCYTMYPIAVIDNAVTVVGPMVFGVFDVEETEYVADNTDDTFIKFVQEFSKQFSSVFGQPTTTKFSLSTKDKLGTICMNVDALDPETYVFDGDFETIENNLQDMMKSTFGDKYQLCYFDGALYSVIYRNGEDNQVTYPMVNALIHYGKHTFINDCNCDCNAAICACDITGNLNTLEIALVDSSNKFNVYNLGINFTSETNTTANNAEAIGKMIMLIDQICKVGKTSNNIDYYDYKISAFSEMLDGMTDEDIASMKMEDVFNYLSELSYNEISKDASAKYTFEFLNNNPEIMKWIIKNKFGTNPVACLKDASKVDLLSNTEFNVPNTSEDPFKKFINAFKNQFTSEFMDATLNRFEFCHFKLDNDGVTALDGMNIVTQVKADDNEYCLGLEYKTVY